MTACSFGFLASNSSATRGKTAGDVLGLGRLARNLGQHITRMYGCAFLDEDMGANGQQVAGHGIAAAPATLAVFPPSSLIDTRGRSVAPECSMMTLRERPGDFIELFLHRDAFDDVAIGHLAADFRENGQRVRIPFDELLRQLDAVSVLDLDLGAVDDRILFALAAVFIARWRSSRCGSSRPIHSLCFARQCRCYARRHSFSHRSS